MLQGQDQFHSPCKCSAISGLRAGIHFTCSKKSHTSPLRSVCVLRWEAQVLGGPTATCSMSTAAALQQHGKVGAASAELGVENCLVQTYAFLNVKYLCLTFFFSMESFISVIYFCGICHGIVPQMLSPPASYKKLISKLCNCSQEARTSHNYSKSLVEENHTLMLYLEEISIVRLLLCMFISACRSLMQQFLLVLFLDVVLLLH